LLFILASLHRRFLRPQGFQQKVRQSLDQSFRASFRWRLMIVVFQLENELSSTATEALLHNPSPSAWKDWIVRLASDSFRATREQRQTR
jgi:hypothetical protein